MAACGKPKYLNCYGIPAQQELSDCLHLPSKMSILTSLKIELMARFCTNNIWNKMWFRYTILDLLEERKWTERNLFPHS